jgi:phytoene dehydrogenase-like protein
MAGKDYDVIVSGAGPGGTACAALLAKQGVNVLLIEKNDRAGGKGMTISKNGFTHELWPVAGVPMYNTRFDELLGELGLESERCHPQKTATLCYKNRSGKYQHLTPPEIDPAAGPGEPPDPSEFLKWLDMGEKDLPEYARFMTDMITLPPEEAAAMDDITFNEFYSRYQLPQSFASYLSALLNIAFVVPSDQVVASEALKKMREAFTMGAGYYSKGGFGRLFERCAETIEKNGGAVSFKTRVEKIIVENGQVKGVVTGKGTFHADIVISNAGIQPTVLKLVGAEHFDEGYVTFVKDLVPSQGLMGTRFFLNTPLLDSCCYISFSDDTHWTTELSLKAKAGHVPEELIVFAIVPSNFDPDLSPPGKQCVLATTMCPPDPDLKNTQDYWDRLDAMMDRVWPQFSNHIESKERFSTKHVSALTRDKVQPEIGGECIGLAQIVGQSGRHKPSPQSPVKGLFYVGCDAGGSGCATNQAVDSAFNVAPMVLSQLKRG